jgi:cytoskeletal protein CcmA (bactofilin family)
MTPDALLTSRLANVTIKGEIQAEEDLTIDSYFEGRIDLRNHRLVVGPDADVRADVYAGELVVFGKLAGTLIVAQAADIRSTATIEGRLVAPILGLSEGARFKGTIDTRNAEVAARVAEHRLRQPAGPAVKTPDGAKRA